MDPMHYKPELIKAIVVDDQPSIRKAIRRVLESIHITHVIECGDGSSAKKELENKAIDLIICDIYLPGIDGFNLLKFIRARSVASDIPFIMVTGETAKDLIIKASDLGCQGYLVKPFKLDDLSHKVLAVLNHYYSPDPLLKLLREGDQLLIQNKNKEALEVYEKAMVQDATSLRASYSVAFALNACGETEKALTLLKKNIDTSSTYYKNYALLADIYLSKKKYDPAIKAMKKELELNPRRADRQNLLAKLYQHQKQLKKSILHYKKSLQEDLKDYDALFGIALCFAKSGDLDKAIHYFKRLRRHYPHDKKPLKALAKFCFASGKSETALGILKEEIRISPDRLDSYGLLAELHLILGEKEKVHEVLRMLFKREPESSEGSRIMGLVYLKDKAYSQALVYFKKITDTLLVKESYLLQAKCHIAMNEANVASDILNKALSLQGPHHGEIFFLLARIFNKNHEFIKSLLFFNKAIQHGIKKVRCQKFIIQCQKYFQITRPQT